MANSYHVKLPHWEGPLDLLLDLIRSEKIDIRSISIEKITSDYLRMLDLMQELNMQLSADFLVMAATLLLIKTHILLPDDPSLDEFQQKEYSRKENLINQLLAYEKYKNASDKLSNLMLDNNNNEAEIKLLAQNNTFASKCIISDEDAEQYQQWRPSSISDLLKAFYKLLDKQRQAKKDGLDFSEIDVESEMSLSFNFIESRLKTKPLEKISLQAIVQQNLEYRRGKQSAQEEIKKNRDIEKIEKIEEIIGYRAQMLICFLCILELYKRNTIELTQKKNFSPIFLQAYIEKSTKS